MEPKTTEAMRRVLDALLEGGPVPESARASLSEAERAELDALVATAVLTRSALHEGDPSPNAEAASLRRAQSLVAAQGRAPRAARPAARGGIAARIARWLGKR